MQIGIRNESAYQIDHSCTVLWCIFCDSTCARKVSTSRDGASPSEQSLFAEVPDGWHSGDGSVRDAEE